MRSAFVIHLWSQIIKGTASAFALPVREACGLLNSDPQFVPQSYFVFRKIAFCDYSVVL